MNSFLNPSEVLKNLKLKNDILAAEFGCGSGGWTIPLAKILEKGKVFAFDILEEKLSVLRSCAKAEKLSNIESKKCDLEVPKSTELADNFLDLVLIPDVLFQVENKKAIMEEAKRVLKKNGQFLISDWNPGASLGPKESRASEEEIKKIAAELALNFKENFEAGTFHYGLLFEK